MTVLYVDRRATEARYDNGAIAFYSDRTRIATIPMAPLTRVVIYGGLTLESTLLGRLGEKNIGVVIITGRKQEPVLFFPRPHNDASRRLKQVLMSLDEEKSLEFAKELVGLKLLRQKELLLAELDHGHSRPLDLRRPAEEISVIAERVREVDSAQSLLGSEGAAASSYFGGLATVLPQSLDFHGRNSRPPQDPFNAVLSLCYTLLYAQMQLMLHTAGFDPFVGFYHRVAFGRASLACDVMEPFRPFADRFAIDAFRQRVLRTEDFSLTPTAGCRIGKAGRERFYPAWEEFVGGIQDSMKKAVAAVGARVDAMSLDFSKTAEAMPNDPSIVSDEKQA